jgi:hypothetical protein
MRPSPLLIFHISVGFVTLLSGAVALVFRKGSHRHKLALTSRPNLVDPASHWRVSL